MAACAQTAKKKKLNGSVCSNSKLKTNVKWQLMPNQQLNNINTNILWVSHRCVEGARTWRHCHRYVEVKVGSQ